MKYALVSEQRSELYAKEGYMILEKVIPDETLQMMREECSYFLGYYDAELDLGGTETSAISHRGRRYFIANRYRLSNRIHQFLFGSLIAEVVKAALGDTVYLFNEQWVVKGPEKGMKFAWHQDSGYVKNGDPMTKHKPYLTCWITLDDVNEENGTVFLLPHSRGGTSHTLAEHSQEEGTNDLIGYTGDDPGDPLIVPAGSVVGFTSYNFHRSGVNTSPNMRRVYLAQYSAEPILRADGSGNWGLAVPFLENGKIVYNREGDTAAKYGGHAGIGR
jgi:ectoine hydroxylase-related dioxygenase (phytanoyl-CoA dioxygenase family)